MSLAVMKLKYLVVNDDALTAVWMLFSACNHACFEISDLFTEALYQCDNNTKLSPDLTLVAHMQSLWIEKKVFLLYLWLEAFKLLDLRLFGVVIAKLMEPHSWKELKYLRV